jgi:hypothetical protein
MTVNGVFAESGAGTFSGSIAVSVLNLSITGQVQIGETCQLNGVLTGTK